METERFIELGETKRWRLDTPIQIYIQDSPLHLAGHSKDISLYGVQIEVGIKLPQESNLTLEIYFQRSNVFDCIDQEPLKVKAQVIWRRAVSEDDYDSRETGLQFVNITEEQQDIIQSEVALIDDYNEG